jgi:hypothetical protein
MYFCLSFFVWLLKCPTHTVIFIYLVCFKENGRKTNLEAINVSYGYKPAKKPLLLDRR